MSLFSRLNSFDTKKNRLINLKKLVSECYWVEVKPTEYYLTLVFINENKQKFSSLMDVSKFVGNNKSLQAISWLDIPNAYLYHWLNDQWGGVTILNQHWALHNVSRTEDKSNGKYLAIPVNGTELLIDNWPEEYISVDKFQHARFLNHTLSFIIGSSRTSISVINNIEAGDVLLIENYEPYIEVNGSRLGRIDITNEYKEVVVSDLSEIKDNYNADHDLLSYDWKELPVTIKYVLGSDSYKLSELENIAEGSIFHLSDKAEQEVRIYVNELLFGFGELVTVDNKALAIELHTINKLKPNSMDVDYGNE